MSTVGEMIRAHRLRKEQDYASSLLAEAMGASGDFSYNRDTGALGYTPGGTMPTKTEAWNNYLRMKGGQATAQDIVSFNQLYSSAQQMQTQNQIQEIQKLQLQGADADDIQDLVGQNPQLYNNLLDMITKLENTPDETGQAALMAGRMRDMIPQPKKSYWEQGMEFAGDHWGKLLGGGVAGMYGYGKLKQADIGTKGRQFFRGYLKSPGAQQELDELLKTTKKHDPNKLKYRIGEGNVLEERIRGKKIEVLKKDGTPKMGKDGKPITKRAPDHWRKTVPGFKGATEASETFSKSQIRSAKNILKYAGPQGLLQMVGYNVAPKIAEEIGGESAREGVEQAMNVSMAAHGGRMLMMQPHPVGKLIGGAMLLGGGYSLFDKEDKPPQTGPLLSVE